MSFFSVELVVIVFGLKCLMAEAAVDADTVADLIETVVITDLGILIILFLKLYSSICFIGVIIDAEAFHEADLIQGIYCIS